MAVPLAALVHEHDRDVADRSARVLRTGQAALLRACDLEQLQRPRDPLCFLVALLQGLKVRAAIVVIGWAGGLNRDHPRRRGIAGRSRRRPRVALNTATSELRAGQVALE